MGIAEVRRSCHRLLAGALLLSGPALAAPAAGVQIGVENLERSAHESVPVTFGHVFREGDVSAGANLWAEPAGGGEPLPVQMDVKTRYANGSVRHAVLSTVVERLTRGTASYSLSAREAAPAGSPPSLESLLATGFDAGITVEADGKSYTASARDLLSSRKPAIWLRGPIVSDWQVSGALKDSSGKTHPRLQVIYGVRTYNGTDRVRVSVTLENSWTHAPAPQNVHYDVTVSLQGASRLTHKGVTHYHQSRWRRTFWSGDMPRLQVLHDRQYLASTRAVPSYAPELAIPGYALDEMQSLVEQQAGDLLGPGLITAYMPTGGARPDIGPLPRWTARYLISQDHRAADAMLATAERAGSFGVHYRDKATGLPVSLDTYPMLTVMGRSGVPPVCQGDCETPYTLDVAHQPSLSYVPYLVTGDYFHLEELQFWANWNLFYWWLHGDSQGLLSADQVRAQAWGLRTIAHAAYATPDDHPLKDYFIEKLSNNLAWYNANYSEKKPTPLGYLLNHESLGLTTFATWMDDYFTWTTGHIVNLGFPLAAPLFEYKSRFPIGRMTDPGYCWILAATYWTPAVDASGKPFQTWDAFRRSVISNWGDESLGASFGHDPKSSTPAMTNDRIAALQAARCDSAEMADLLGLQRGDMIGYAWDPENQVAWMQPALAIAVELDAPGARAAWEVFSGRSVKPGPGERYNHNLDPHWAIVPAANAAD